MANMFWKHRKLKVYRLAYLRDTLLFELFWFTYIGEVYSIQHCFLKFDSDLQQVGGFLWVLRFPPPIKLTATI